MADGWHCKRCDVHYTEQPHQVMMDRDEFGRIWFPCCFASITPNSSEKSGTYKPDGADFRADGETFDADLDSKRLGKQMLLVLGCMQDRGWRTLSEIRVITQAPEASISARLRDVRKRWGEGAMESRRRASAGLESGLWEFRVNLPEGTEL